MKRFIVTASLLTLAAFGFRLYIVLKASNDSPDDGRLYAQMAKTLLDYHVYSTDGAPPVNPTYDRVPGYPIFLAGVYKLFGRDNNTAVRYVQLFIGTFTCWIIALIAFYWTPTDWDIQKRRRTLLIALALAAACPFTAIYVGTILTEIIAMALETGAILTATIALQSPIKKKVIVCWAVCGLLGGISAMFRPDGALFVGSSGLALVIINLIRAYRRRKSSNWKQPIGAAFGYGAVLSGGFIVAMAPWTIRNAVVFKVLQPVAPVQAAMPNEFVPYGYINWLRSWVDDVCYTEVLEWNVDYKPIHIDQLPPYAFDSDEQKQRIEALLERYNHEQPGTEAARLPFTHPPSADDEETTVPEVSSDDDDNDQPANDMANPSVHAGKEYNVEMTQEVSDGFGEIAQERFKQHPIRCYVWTPFKRVLSMWFDNHSQYYPFDGEMFPLWRLDKDRHQQYWLPLFLLITIFYSLIALAGAWVMFRGKGARRWLLLASLIILLRMAFLSWMENPEPRYVVELFPYLTAAGALGLSCISLARLRKRFGHRKESLSGS